MIEVPALLWQLPALMAEADFVSIGSNDLMQFLFAADRGTPGAGQPLRPAVARRCWTCWSAIAAAAAAAGVEVSVCGEHASRPLEAMVLAALGHHHAVDAGGEPAAAQGGAGAAWTWPGCAAGAGRRCGATRRARRACASRSPSWAREHGCTI